MKKLSGTIRPQAQRGQRSAWTAEDDATTVSMIAGSSAYAKIAMAIGKGLKKKDIINRWKRYLKHRLKMILAYVFCTFCY